uniref:Uncharacterized protein n=1 Tax=viral metagenome TaxID=1070528 RepID=A0A6M3IF80_9ZZZZ
MAKNKSGEAAVKGDEMVTEGVDKVEEKANNLLTSEQKLEDGSLVYSRANEDEGGGLGIGIFSDEARPSLEELMGESEEVVEEKGEVTAEEGEVKAEEKAEVVVEEKKAEVKADVKKADTEEKVVPLTALHEERENRKRLASELTLTREELRDLRKEFTLLKSESLPRKGEEKAEEKEDEVIASFTKKAEELEDLVEDNPVNASKEMLKLIKSIPGMLKKSAEIEKVEAGKVAETTAEDKGRLNTIISEGMGLMEELVPGITDLKESDVNKNLTVFAKEVGITADFLQEVTNPGTVITTVDGNSRYIGKDAAYFVSVLDRAFKAKDPGVATEEMKAVILKENEEGWKKAIREEVTKEIVAKIGKGEKIDIGAININELPGESDADTELIGSRVLSEEEVAALNPAQKRKYLGGF